MEKSDQNDKRLLLLSITASLVSVGLYYATHVEYLKIFALIFWVFNAVAVGLSGRTRNQKLRDACILTMIALVIYAGASFSWR